MSKSKSEVKIAYAVLVSIADGKSVGSGFRLLLEGRVYLVTARHVLYGEKGLHGNILVATSYGGDDLDLDPMILKFDLTKVAMAEDESTDVVVLCAGSVVISPKSMEEVVSLAPGVSAEQWGVKRGLSISARRAKSIGDIELGSTVFLLGYPTSLGMVHNKYYDFTRPLLRKGSVAGLELKRGTFVIDCPAYPGNSGGPVLAKGSNGTFHVIGVVSRYIPFETKWYSNREHICNTEVSNSGYTVCVAIDSVLKAARTLAK